MERYLTAIDFGSYSMKIAIGKKDKHGKIEIVSLNHVKPTGLKRGIILNLPNAINDLTQLKGMAEKDINGPLENVTVNISGQNIDNTPSENTTFLRDFKNIYFNHAVLSVLNKCLKSLDVTYYSTIPDPLTPLYCTNDDKVLTINIGHSLIHAAAKYNSGLHHIISIVHHVKTDDHKLQILNDIKKSENYVHCNKVVLCGGLSNDERLINEIRGIYYSKEVELLAFKNIYSKTIPIIRNGSNASLFGMLNYRFSLTKM